MSDAPDYTAAVEALLFVATDPLSADALLETLTKVEGVPLAPEVVDGALESLGARYAANAHGVQLVQVAGGWALRTSPAQARFVRGMYKKPPVRLSRAALEVLAVVAYRQPCTRADIEDVRGVDCSGLLRTLLERGLLRIIGKADDVGRPLLYGTSPEFLTFFGLKSLGDLPTLREYTELTEEHVVRLQELDETLRATEQAENAATGADAPASSTSALLGTPSGDAQPESSDE